MKTFDEISGRLTSAVHIYTYISSLKSSINVKENTGETESGVRTFFN